MGFVVVPLVMDTATRRFAATDCHPTKHTLDFSGYFVAMRRNLRSKVWADAPR
jgi:hypothetical protein